MVLLGVETGTPWLSSLSSGCGRRQRTGGYRGVMAEAWPGSLSRPGRSGELQLGVAFGIVASSGIGQPRSMARGDSVTPSQSKTLLDTSVCTEDCLGPVPISTKLRLFDENAVLCIPLLRACAFGPAEQVSSQEFARPRIKSTDSQSSISAEPTCNCISATLLHMLVLCGPKHNPTTRDGASLELRCAPFCASSEPEHGYL